jgi:hypothetical protein
MGRAFIKLFSGAMVVGCGSPHLPSRGSGKSRYPGDQPLDPIASASSSPPLSPSPGTPLVITHISSRLELDATNSPAGLLITGRASEGLPTKGRSEKKWVMTSGTPGEGRGEGLAPTLESPLLQTSRLPYAIAPRFFPSFPPFILPPPTNAVKLFRSPPHLPAAPSAAERGAK